MMNDIATTGNHVYLALGFPGGQRSGLAVFDISDPAHPRPAGSASTASRAYQVAVEGNLACLAATSLVVVDILFAPQVTASLDFPPYVSNVALAGRIAYVTCAQGGLAIVDVSQPAAPVVLGSVDTPGTGYDVAVLGTYAYVADGASGLQVVDVSNPSVPRLRGSVDTEGIVYDVALAGTWVYVTGDLGLTAIDVADPDAPVLAGTTPTRGSARSISIVDERAIVAVNDGL
jgi:hypothetical protein